MLKGKTVLLGVSGGIAAYKMPNLARMLIKAGAEVHVIMTKNACEFITPFTFETLTKHKCIVDTFDKNFEYSVEHVSLAKKADLLIIAPATANVIAKLACGIADDMLTTTALACNCPKIIAPAMNTNMYDNPIVQDNIARLRRFGYEVIEPDSGYLACGDTGRGKMPSPESLLWYILKETAYEKDMKDIKLCVTAGPTREAIDPVRFISNNSTGKMGYAIARMAMLRGADVTLVSGKVDVPPVPFVNIINVISAQDMYDAVTEEAKNSDIIIKAAAVADYTPLNVSDNKIKKKDGDMSIALKRTKDIIGTLGEHKKEGQFICGFSMETENVIANSKDKLIKKNMDMIVANNVKVAGAGFGTDTNVVTIITGEDNIELPMMSKEDVASKILDFIMAKRR